jgi:hypothetical protein
VWGSAPPAGRGATPGSPPARRGRAGPAEPPGPSLGDLQATMPAQVGVQLVHRPVGLHPQGGTWARVRPRRGRSRRCRRYGCRSSWGCGSLGFRGHGTGVPGGGGGAQPRSAEPGDPPERLGLVQEGLGGEGPGSGLGRGAPARRGGPPGGAAPAGTRSPGSPWLAGRPGPRPGQASRKTPSRLARIRSRDPHVSERPPPGRGFLPGPSEKKVGDGGLRSSSRRSWK